MAVYIKICRLAGSIKKCHQAVYIHYQDRLPLLLGRKPAYY